MFKVIATERGLAAEEEMKELNKIVHSRELVINYSTDNQNIYNTVGKKEITYFYCCGTYWPAGIQCPVC